MTGSGLEGSAIGGGDGDDCSVMGLGTADFIMGLACLGLEKCLRGIGRLLVVLFETLLSLFG